MIRLLAPGIGGITFTRHTDVRFWCCCLCWCFIMRDCVLKTKRTVQDVDAKEITPETVEKTSKKTKQKLDQTQTRIAQMKVQLVALCMTQDGQENTSAPPDM